jgi:lipoprotein-anchoring transpeptidase ErfK/SrfK
VPNRTGVSSPRAASTSSARAPFDPWQSGKDTLYRIHGTLEPWTIGQAVSSGCIRMANEDVIDLYERVKVGTKVVVKN